ncbi:helix-turn-helix domain-containing protein [Bacillus altitudinis]
MVLESSISSQIRKRRKELGLSQLELASKSGMPQSTIARIESGEISPRENELSIISNVLKATLVIGEESFSKADPFVYIVQNKVFQFEEDCGFNMGVNEVMEAIHHTNATMLTLPYTVFQSIDFKATSGMIGALFCKGIENVTDGIVNPIEKGHPDIVPKEAAGIRDESILKHYPVGLEVKCTAGNVKQGSDLGAGDTRIQHLKGVTWQAHHQEVERLMGITWDFIDTGSDANYPVITGVFYANNLNVTDWGKISGITGRNTKVTGMAASGKAKMGKGWIAILDSEEYKKKYTSIFKIKL